MIAITESIELGLISGAVGVISAISVAIPAIISARRTNQAIGKPNGAGNIVQMSEEVLKGLHSVKEDIAHLRRDAERKDARMDHLTERIDGLYERLPASGGNEHGQISRSEVASFT